MLEFKDLVKATKNGFADGYKKGQEDSNEYVAELYSKFALGLISLDDIKKEAATLENKQFENGIKLGSAQRYLERLNKLVDLCQGDTAMPFSSKQTILKMRSLVRADFVEQQYLDKEIVARFKSCIWFDFRNLAATSNREMADFGRELIAEGIAQLPFPECVFVFPFASVNGDKAHAAFYLVQEDRKISCRGIFFFPEGKPIGLTGFAEAGYDAIHYAIAVLGSRSSQQIARSIETGQVMSGAGKQHRGPHYVEVTIAPNLNTSTGSGKSHASPRLHWRRGHIRRYPNKTTWIEAMLVGKSDNGVVVHDYKMG